MKVKPFFAVVDFQVAEKINSGDREHASKLSMRRNIFSKAGIIQTRVHW
jgi:hypothetical protein